jgi:hypothetical protein
VIASRWARPVLALLLAALVPTVLHTYGNWRSDAGRPASDVPLRLGSFDGKAAAGDHAWLREAFATSDWLHRRYTGPDGASLELLIARSYDAKRLYHHPEKATPFARDMVLSGLAHVPVGRAAPAHVLTSERGATAAYALLYDGEFVGDPLWFQVREAARSLVQPRRPMTLFLVYDRRGKADASAFTASRAGRLLQAAIQGYLSEQ